MKIAISTEGNAVSAHFGRCPSYTIVDIQEGQIVKKEKIENPGHSPGFLPNYLSERGVNCVIAGGMGSRAQNLFRQKHIEPIIGVQGLIDEVIDKFLNKKLEKGEDLCEHPKTQSRPAPQHQPLEKTDVDTKKRICFTAQGGSIEDDLDPRFGRAAFFLIYDPETKSIESLENPNKNLTQGVGPMSVQFLSENNVEILFTGQIGPNAQRVLQASKIKVISGASGKIKDLLRKYKIEVQ
jgi:predicted Fe-Mo cluster-binding NifX family protein